MNIQGLVTKRVNKLHTPGILNVFQNHDVVLFTETLTNEFSELHVENVDYFVLNRTENKPTAKRTSGGIIVYIRSMFVSSDTHVFESADDIICINISGDTFSLDTPLYIYVCYVVPENSCRQALKEMHTFDRLTDFIAELYSKHDGNNCNFVLCGDM